MFSRENSVGRLRSHFEFLFRVFSVVGQGPSFRRVMKLPHDTEPPSTATLHHTDRYTARERRVRSELLSMRTPSIPRGRGGWHAAEPHQQIPQTSPACKNFYRPFAEKGLKGRVVS